MFTALLNSRGRVMIASGISMFVSDLATAKFSTFLVGAKATSVAATKAVATKVIAKATALWMIIMSFFVPIHQTMPVPAHKPAIHRHAHATIPLLVKNEDETVSEKPLYLHTLEKEYTAVFLGKVNCGETPCNSASVQIHLVSKKNPNIVKTITPQPDGSYQVSFLVKEYLHEHLDWWITADSPDSTSKQVQGREILTEESNIEVDQSITLL